jgi:16S rRNA (cytosine1402-N4)-methyltransferase
MLKEVLDFLDLKPGKIIVDGTVGSGGHSLEILKRILPDGFLIGIDIDEDALRRAGERLKVFEGKFSLHRENYKNIALVLEKENINKIDGLLLDLGFSSEQIEDANRGFSFLKDAPLDMRYDTSHGETARDVINREGREKLAWIFRNFGEERKAERIASRIVEKRREKPIETTMEIARIAAQAKAFSAKEKINPATRIFQALRIYVNRELENIKEALLEAIRAISTRGRICTISYHSLEDRLVKTFFKEEALQGRVRIITPHPVTPSKEEIKENRRSRSAKLRACEVI